MFPYFFYHTWKFLACSLIKFNNQIFPPCSFIPKSVILDLEKKSSLLIYSSLLVYEFSKKCQSASLFWSTRLLGTSEYFGTRELIISLVENEMQRKNLSDPLLISTDFLKYPFWHLFQTGIKFQL